MTLIAIAKHLIGRKLHNDELIRMEMITIIDECFKIEQIFSNHSNDNS